MTIADDPDYIGLVQTDAGQRAFGLFVALIVQAKVQRNEGHFTEPEAVVAVMVCWPVDAFKAALQTLIDAPGRWVVRKGQAIIIRTFSKWNDVRGGQRPGAGRKPAGESKRNQSEIKQDSKGVTPVSVSVSVSGSVFSDENTSAGEAPASAPSQTAKPVRSKPKEDDPLHWTPEHGWEGITDADRSVWANAYPAVNITAAMARADQWLRANPTKARKKLWRKFLTGWMGRDQERGGDSKSSRSNGFQQTSAAGETWTQRRERETRERLEAEEAIGRNGKA